MNAFRAIGGILLATATVALLWGAQTLLGENEHKELLLPGSALSLERGVEQAGAIVIGTVDQLEMPDPTAPNRADYPAKITVTKVLKGPAELKRLAITIRVEHQVKEIAPEVKISYIFLLASHPHKEWSLLKMLPDDEASQTAVAELIKKKGSTTRSDK